MISVRPAGLARGCPAQALKKISTAVAQIEILRCETPKHEILEPEYRDRIKDSVMIGRQLYRWWRDHQFSFVTPHLS